ncbi:hypothetical protein KY284_025277 [Solanum tuberosum]|nr:hypothetical protein KY284_025277 [Solanum tuberosum]
MCGGVSKKKKEGGGNGSSKKKKGVRQVWVTAEFEMGERGVWVGVRRTKNKVGVEDFEEGERREWCRLWLREAKVIGCEEEERVGLLVDKGGGM